MRENATSQERIDAAINLALVYGGVDGEHHKQWVIAQMVKILKGKGYRNFVKRFESDGNEWDEGIAP